MNRYSCAECLLFWQKDAMKQDRVPDYASSAMGKQINMGKHLDT